MIYQDTKAYWDENARRVMAQSIANDQVGRTLTPEAQKEAAEFAASIWKGNTTVGKAADIAIKAVSRTKQ